MRPDSHLTNGGTGSEMLTCVQARAVGKERKSSTPPRRPPSADLSLLPSCHPLGADQSVSSRPVCVDVLGFSSFRSHPGSSASPVLPGVHSSDHQGEQLQPQAPPPPSGHLSCQPGPERFFVQVLDQWFESEPLKATLATDAVIGAMTSPHMPGSG